MKYPNNIALHKDFLPVVDWQNNIVPFIIDNDHKQYYIRGLREFENIKGYLMDTCLSAQDTFAEWMKYFYGEM